MDRYSRKEKAGCLQIARTPGYVTAILYSGMWAVLLLA